MSLALCNHVERQRHFAEFSDGEHQRLNGRRCTAHHERTKHAERKTLVRNAIDDRAGPTDTPAPTRKPSV